jgi:hypothetical protein
MPKTYAANMRSRVIARVESEASRREAAAERIAKVGAPPVPRVGCISRLEEHMALLALIDKQPDLTLDEVVSST